MDTKACSKCGEVKTLDLFARKGKGKIRGVCKECHNAYQREYWQRSGTWDRQRDRIAQYKRDNKAKLTAAKYGITEEQYVEGMSGPCQVCGLRPAEVVDHCHNSQDVRGFLCGPCNTGIGMLGDSLDRLRKAVLYLDNQ